MSRIAPSSALRPTRHRTGQPSTTASQRIVVVASCGFFRDVVTYVAKKAGGFDVVGVFKSAAEAGETVVRVAPALVVVGQFLDDGLGVDLVRRLQPRLPAAQWLLVMQEDNAPTAREAHAIGIGGIMLKRSGFAELQRAILTLRAVRRFRGAGIGALLAASGSTADATAACGMTKREREVLHWVAEGKRNHEIATILGNRPGTVCKQMESILRKLGVETRGAAVATWRATCTTRGCSLCR